MKNAKATAPKSTKTAASVKPATKAVRGEYQGKPTLCLTKGEGDKWPFTFGLAKARLMLAHIADIQQFVADSAE